MHQAIPKWVSALSIMVSILGLFVGCSLYFSPATFVKGIDFSAEGVLFLPHMWAARQMAVALIIGYSVFKQSAPMLKVSLIAYWLTIFQDIIIGASHGNGTLIIGLLFFCFLSGSMIIGLARA